MARIADNTEELCIYNQEIEEIVAVMKSFHHNASMTQQERNHEISALLTEMEEYTQPLVHQIDAMSESDKHLILHRIVRLFPEIVQKEIKSLNNAKSSSCQPPLNLSTDRIDETSSNNSGEFESESAVNAKLANLGWTQLNDLLNTFDFNEHSLNRKPARNSRRQSEKQTSDHVEKQLNEWKLQKEITEKATIQKIKEDKKNKVSKKRGPNNSEKVMLMMGIQNVENKQDIEAICNASNKARRKLL